MKNKKLEINALVFLLMLSLVFFSKIVLHSTWILYSPASDVINQFMYLRGVSHKEIRNGLIPYWNPHILSGTPFSADVQTAVFYPLTILFYIFPTELTFGVFLLTHLFISGFLMFLLLRNLELDVFPSLLGAISFMFSGVFVSGIWGGGITTVPSMTWIPLVFLLSERALTKKSFFYGILTGIPLTLSFLGGHTQFFWLTTLALFLFYVHGFILGYHKTRNLFISSKLFSIFGISLLFFSILSAIQLLPSIELARYSTRSQGLSFDYAVSYSFHPNHLLSFLFPEFYGSDLDGTYWGKWSFDLNYVYLGVAPLILAFLAILYRRKEQHVLFFTCLGILSLFLAFGGYNPFYKLALHVIPLLTIFRAPARFLFLTTFSLSVLSAFGASILLELKDKKQARWLRYLSQKVFVYGIVLFFLSLILLFCAKLLDSNVIPDVVDDYLRVRYGARHSVEWYVKHNVERFFGVQWCALEWIPSNIASFSFFVVIIFFGFEKFFSGRFSVKKFKAFILLVVLLDLWFYGLPYVDVKDPMEVFKETDAVKFIKEDSSVFRVLSMQKRMPGYHIPTLKQNFGALFGLNMVDGVNSIQVSHYREFIEAGNKVSQQTAFLRVTEIINPVFLSLLNTKYVLSPNELNLSNFNLVGKDSISDSSEENISVFIYENKGVLPRAFIVRNAEVVEDKKLILEEIKNETFNPREYVLLEENLGVALKNLGEFQEAEITSKTPNEIKVRVNLSSPGFLVLSEVWYPSWRAYDNGIETKVYKADYVLRAVYLASGDHTVEFRYDSSYFKVGAFVSLAAILVLSAICFARIKRHSTSRIT